MTATLIDRCAKAIASSLQASHIIADASRAMSDAYSRRQRDRTTQAKDAALVEKYGAKWDESKHPRDKDGKFGSGGGSAGQAKEQNADAAPEEASVKHAAKHIQAISAKFTPDEMARKKPTQPRNTKQAVFAHAAKVLPSYQKVLNMGQGLSKALGADVIDANQKKGSKDEALQAVANGTAGAMILIAPPKGEDRATEKVNDKYGGDWSKLTDVVRGTVIVPTVADMPKAVDALREELTKGGWSIVEVENKFATPTKAGYRDLSLNIASDDGHVAELQLSTHAMWYAKETVGHKMYEEFREIDENPDRTPADEARQDELAAQMKQLYGEAWKKSV